LRAQLRKFFRSRRSSNADLNLANRLGRRGSRNASDCSITSKDFVETTTLPTAVEGDPLGLTMRATCSEPLVDVIFVHGLRGGSVRSWCRNRDRKLFWPGEFLPEDLPRARIYTFGYDANFTSAKSDLCNVLDFAKQLLFAMGFSPDGLGKVS
jgi:hypothetical protein